MKIQVLVVDDSAFMRLLLSDLLSQDRDLEVVGTATDGKSAVSQTRKLKPDAVVLDMNMGQYDGLYAVEQIMKTHPVPILILSSLGNTNLDPIFDALELGAVDYINKPQQGGSKVRQMGKELVNAVKRVARARPKTTRIVKNGLNQLPHVFEREGRYHLIVIGASTGGPTAVEKIITTLPANLNVPVVIGQHMPPNFIHSFTHRLNGVSPLAVQEGRKGMKIMPGHVIVAPGDANMIVEKTTEGVCRIGFTTEVFKEYNHPSINALMESVARCYGKTAIGVLLTGMGRDGVNGLQAIKDHGGFTIAQDESSSVIYGMPKMAVESGAVDSVLHIKDIGGYLVNCL